MWSDVRYGLRLARLSPGFSALVVLTFALAIGLNTALFSVVDALLLRALPGFETGRIVVLGEKRGGNDFEGVNGATLRAWRAQAKSFESIEAGTFDPLNLTAVDVPEVVRSARVTAGYFRLYRVHALLGRTFLPGEDSAGRNRVAVLDHAFWMRKFGGDPGIVGRTIRLDRQSHIVAGILPPDFHPLGRDVSLYVPLAMEELPAWSFWTVARLRSSATLDSAQREMASISRMIVAVDPAKKGVEARVVPLHEVARRTIRTGLLTLFTAVGLVLLIACANIANLFLARTAARSRELGVRLALGAKPSRVVRQIVTEGLLLAMAGGLCGVLLAWWSIAALRAASPEMERLDEVRLNWTVMAFALALTFASGLLATAGPAFAILRNKLAEGLQQSNPAAQRGTDQSRARRLLAIAEIGITFLLVTASALAIESFERLRHVELGYDPRHLLTLMLSAPAPEQAEGGALLSLYGRIAARIEALPGVQDVALATKLPIGGIAFTYPLRVQGRPEPDRDVPEAQTSIVAPGYFRILGIPVRRGRAFGERDRRGAALTAMVNESIARTVFGTQDPIGKRLMIETLNPNATASGKPVAREIVGVVGDVKEEELREKSPFQLYLPLEQNPVAFINLAIRTRGDPAALERPVLAAIASEDRDLPASGVKPMEVRVHEALADFGRAAALVTGFAMLALALALVGIYGVVSYGVSRRTREIGIRLALGAGAGGVTSMILRETAWLAVMGVGAGLVAIVAFQRVIDSQLYGIGATDPLSLMGTALGLIAVAVVAALKPALWAARVDPMQCLRAE